MKKLLLLVVLFSTITTPQLFAQDSTKTTTLSQLLSSYYNIKNALVKTDAITAAAKAAEFVQAINDVDIKALSETDHNAFMVGQDKLKTDAQTIATGKTLYTTHCKSCHGAKGMGDGSKAAQLKTEAGDFTKATFQSQTDGALFYKTSEGRDDMPSFKKKVPDEDDRWALVNFMRTLKK